MAKQQGNKNRGGKKRPLLPLYFFLNDQIHKKLHINRGRDIVTAWNYPEEKKVITSYSATINRYKPAFSTPTVIKMINRSRSSLDVAMKGGMIEMPQHTYGLDENKNRFQYFWREEDIMALLEYFSGIHQGRPRKDGEITVNNLPTPREVRAMIHDEEILYVKQGDTYEPTWRAKEF